MGINCPRYCPDLSTAREAFVPVPLEIESYINIMKFIFQKMSAQFTWFTFSFRYSLQSYCVDRRNGKNLQMCYRSKRDLFLCSNQIDFEYKKNVLDSWFNIYHNTISGDKRFLPSNHSAQLCVYMYIFCFQNSRIYVKILIIRRFWIKIQTFFFYSETFWIIDEI